MSLGQGIILIFLIGMLGYVVLDILDEKYSKCCKKFTTQKRKESRQRREKLEEIKFKKMLRREDI